MSALQNTDQYVVRDSDHRFPAGGHVIMNHSGTILDRFATHRGAEYAARLLNSGLAYIDHHATVGCKVVAR